VQQISDFFIAPFSVLKEETLLLCYILRGIYMWIGSEAM